MATIRIHCRQEDGEVVSYTPTEETDFRDPTDFVAYLMARDQGETVTLGCVIAEYVREEEKPPLFDMSKHPFAVGDRARMNSAPPHFASVGQIVEVIHLGRAGDTPLVTVRNVDTQQEIRCSARMLTPFTFTTYQHFNTRVIRRLDGSSNGLGLVAADLAHCMDGITGEGTTHWNHPFAGEGPESSGWSDVDLDDHSKAYCKVLNEWAARHNVEIYD